MWIQWASGAAVLIEGSCRPAIVRPLQSEQISMKLTTGKKKCLAFVGIAIIGTEPRYYGDDPYKIGSYKEG